jgi:GxxExxY protein
VGGEDYYDAPEARATRVEWTQPAAGVVRWEVVNRKDDEETDPSTTWGEPDGEMNRLTETVIGAAIEVHRVLGPGLLESFYEEALCVELTERGVSFVRQPPHPVLYKGVLIGEARPDLIVDERVLVELKAAYGHAPVHLAQVLSYLRATRLTVGLLINFNVRLLREGVRRVVNTPAI